MAETCLIDDPFQTPGCNIIQWKENFTVGKLTRVNGGLEQHHRYVRLSDVGKLLAQHGQAQAGKVWTWHFLPWAKAIVGTWENHTTVVQLSGPLSTTYRFAAHAEDDPIETPIRTPHLAWIGQWQPDGGLYASQLLCSKNPILGLSSNCHYWPFGNVHTTGKICWGQVQAHLGIKPENFDQLAGIFFQSGFNTDLFYCSEELAEILRHDGDGDRIDLAPYIPTTMASRPLQQWIRFPGESL